MEVLLGACQAMKYLHTIMEPPTIHRDIKRLVQYSVYD